MSSFNAPALAQPIQPTKQQAASAELRRRALVALQGRDILEFWKEFANFKVEIDEFHIELCKLVMKFVQDMENQLSPRLLLSAPPRTGKTQVIVRSLIPFLAGLHPEWESKVFTSTAELASAHGRDIRNIMADPRYNLVFPDTRMDPALRSVDNIGYVNSKNKPYRGSFKAISITGTMLGLGCDVAVLDDVNKDQAEARSDVESQKVYDSFESGVMSRITPGGGVLIMAQRLAEKDLAGRIMDGPYSKQFIYHKFPAFDDEGKPLVKRYHKLWLADRESKDAKTWSSMYMCEPFAPDGDVFKLADLERNVIDEMPKTVRYYFTCDPAASSKETSDFWVIGVFAVDTDDNVIWADQFRMRGITSLTYVEALFELAEKYKPAKIFIERCHASNVLEPLINKTMRERRTYYNIEYPTPGNKDKIARSQSISGRVSQNKVKFIRSSFNATLFKELCAFPDGKNDDTVDCLSMIGRALDTTISPVLDVPEPELDIDHASVDYVFNNRRAKRGSHDSSPSCIGLARRPSSLY